jgi:ubiquinol-cytochrome c reductase cytochrome c subunit
MFSFGAPVLGAALMFATTTGAQAPPAAPKPPAAATTDAGRQLFVSYGCWQCHGYEGQGGAAGPRIAPRPLALEPFSRIVRRPPNEMPRYTERMLPTADLVQIHAYLQSRPAPPAAQNIPLLRP